MQPQAEFVQIQVDDRRREQRQRLAHDQAAHHGVAERLAQLRTRAAAERQRQRAEQRRHGGHHDRPEAQQAGLADGVVRRQMLLALRLDGEVHHHDAVFLHDADQQNDADQRHHRQIDVEHQQYQQRAHARRGQRGENRQRMDVALIEHAENDVHGHQRRENQIRLALQRALEGLRRALEVAGDRSPAGACAPMRG